MILRANHPILSINKDSEFRIGLYLRSEEQDNFASIAWFFEIKISGCYRNACDAGGVADNFTNCFSKSDTELTIRRHLATHN